MFGSLHRKVRVIGQGFLVRFFVVRWDTPFGSVKFSVVVSIVKLEARPRSIHLEN